MNASSQDVYYQTDSPTTADSLSQVIVNKIHSLEQSIIQNKQITNTKHNLLQINMNKCIYTCIYV